MASVNASGSVWSAVYLDHASSKGDQEGFLIGEVIKEVTTNISDSQISRKTEQISINVYSHHSCTEPFSFYDNRYHLDQVRLLAMLKDDYRNVVGWYQMRRNVPLEPTLRDVTLHYQLLKLLRNVSQEPFILGLFSSNMTRNQSVHSMLHQFYTITKNCFTTLPLAVHNLGETAQTEYRLSGSAIGSAANSTYSQILNSFKPKLLHPGGTVDGAQKVHQLNETIHERLKNLTGSVNESETQVQRLTDEINDLERRAQRQRRERQAIAPSAGNQLPLRPAALPVKSPSPIQIKPSAPPVPAHKAPVSHSVGYTAERYISLKQSSRIGNDTEEHMDTNRVENKAVEDPADPFAGLLADMKKSIKKTPSFKINANMGDGPRTDRSRSLPPSNNIGEGEIVQRQPTRSSSFVNERSGKGNLHDMSNSGDNKQLLGNALHNSSQEHDKKSIEKDVDDEEDDATQMSENFQYTQSGSPTF